jgi:hypothetical protein
VRRGVIVADPEKLDGVVKELMQGLTIIGAHHKQHHMEQALRLLTGDEWTNTAKDHFQWDDGVPS